MYQFKSLRTAYVAAAILALVPSWKQATADVVSPIRHDYADGEVTKLCDEAIKQANQRFDKIAKIPTEKRNYRNTMLAFEKATANLSDKTAPLTFMNSVSTNEKVSHEGSECEQKLGQFYVTTLARKDLYQSLKSAKTHGPARARLLSQTLQAFEDNGLNLPDDQLNELIKLKKDLAIKESQFSTNLNKDQSTVEFTVGELAGVPQDFIDSLSKTRDGKLLVTTKEPHYARVIDNASNPETRKRMLQAFENRVAQENTVLLGEAIQLRQKIASVLGYKTWADYRTHNRMAKDSQTVSNFLGGLKDKLAQRNKEDLAKLLKLKQETETGATELKAWDIRYYANQLKKKELNLDDERIREYFPADLVVAGLFKVYSKILGVTYVEQKDAKVWAEGVKLYQIRESNSEKPIGYFYTDFIPRAGKYGHAAAFTLINGRKLKHKRYSLPVASIVANFSAPENGKPSLMTHAEVTTLFHEFGHIMHQTLTRAPYASLSGANVDQDFVEAPSQMLENWAYSSEILESLSGHYLDRSKKLPPEYLQKLIESRDFNQGYYYTRQLLFGLLDMSFHTASGAVDTTAVYNGLFKELMGVDAVEGGHFPASFGHLMGGYDAGYYGYLWSEVYAADMFTRFNQEGLLNSNVGHDYRKIILEKGKMKDAMALLTEFLGRKPNTDAFYKKLNIK